MGIRPLVRRRRLTYLYVAPFHLVLAIGVLDAGGTNVMGFCLTPIDDERVRIYASLWRNDLEGSVEPWREAIDFEAAVIEEDLALQSRMEVLSMSLDITTGVHTGADKTTVELLHVFADLVAAASRGSSIRAHCGPVLLWA